jgi:aerobic-type carbon monoxide dehydrogenase small subunit (CoxS/CutS family)
MAPKHVISSIATRGEARARTTLVDNNTTSSCIVLACYKHQDLVLTVEKNVWTLKVASPLIATVPTGTPTPSS